MIHSTEALKKYSFITVFGTHLDEMAEFADVLAWLTTIANVAGVDLTEAVAQKYGSG